MIEHVSRSGRRLIFWRHAPVIVLSGLLAQQDPDAILKRPAAGV